MFAKNTETEESEFYDLRSILLIRAELNKLYQFCLELLQFGEERQEATGNRQKIWKIAL